MIILHTHGPRIFRLGLAVMALAISSSALAANPSTGPKIAVTGPSPSGDDYPTAHTPEAIRSWLKSTTNLPPAQVISIGADMVVGFAKTGSLDPITGHIKGAELRGEALSPKFTKMIQGRSSLASLDVNCTTVSAMIHETKIYSKANLTGEVTILPGSGNWITPPKTAYLSEAIDAICRADFKRPFRDDAAPVMVASAPLTQSDSPRPPAPPKPIIPLAPVAPLVPQVKTSGSEAQIIAASSAQAAEAARQRVNQQLPMISVRRPFRVEMVTVNGKTYYRGLFGGFSDRSAAQAFCKTLSAASLGCLVR